ncbi:glutathione S-transferase family protein [Sphingomonas alba]|uniref:Glutathione S-transferase family protein n=1 Tax=Sphingomonas alba TaxID=2908208 RepID=A0ABT0RN57_9SPHN|nr:glutathione S-transferase family protein [Sphingomonas alba]MCL6684087.1 glutathione S-transferase family protein [Sphingomonas alba]
MKLYSFPPSPNVRKVSAVISHLGIADVDMQLVNLAKGEQRLSDFLSINPMGRLPALVDDDGFVLWESNAICQFLCERQGASAFYPNDARTRADIARWLFWDASSWAQATEILTHENVRKPMMQIGQPDAERILEGEERFRPLAKLLNDQLADRPFLAGNHVTLADFVVAGSATYLERGQFPVKGLPNLQAWWARLHEIPAWKDTVPSSQLPS